MIMLACVLFGSWWVLAKYILYDISYWNLFFWSRIGGFLAACSIVLAVPSYRDTVLKVGEIPKKSFGLLTLSESINIVASFIGSIALSKGLASAVSAVVSSLPIFVLAYALVLSRFFRNTFQEEVQRSALPVKLAAGVLIIIGFFLVGKA